MPRPQNTGGEFWLLRSTPCNLETETRPIATAPSYLCEGDGVGLALPVYVVWLHQVQGEEVQSKLTDVLVARSQAVRTAPPCVVAPGVSLVPEDELEGLPD